MRRPESKLMTLETAAAWRDALRQRGRSLVITNGCFDLLHRGHVQYLAAARQLGDALLVAVNSDASIRMVKGPDRPVVCEGDRSYMLACLESTDAVVLFSDPKPLRLQEALCPDIYAKGGDYTVDTIDQEERRLLESLCCTFRFLPLITGLSTTETIRRVKTGPPAEAPKG